MGCLSAPVRLLGWLAVIAALALGWLYRDRLIHEGRRLLGGQPAAAPAVSAGRPGARALESARSKVDSLNGWRADSIVLTPAEVAASPVVQAAYLGDAELNVEVPVDEEVVR